MSSQIKKNWIRHPLHLLGTSVNLFPLEKEHFDELYLAAADKRLWQFVPVDCSERSAFDLAYTEAIAERAAGNEYPFVIFHKESKQIIGSTRFFEMFPEHRKLEIGWTWITQPYWGTTVNLECKLLLLQYCFDTLHTVRVQLKTKDDNLRSRKAIEKIGGRFEGIFRKDKIQADGTTRNAAYYSILDNEWPNVQARIIADIHNIEKRR